MGSINRATLQISDKLRTHCSPAELQEITAWVIHYRAIEELKQRHAALTLPEQIATAAKWFAAAPADDLTRQVAGEVMQSMGLLRRALNRRELI